MSPKPNSSADASGKGPSGVDSDPLAILQVIDRLEVGPVRVEKKRLVAPYTVHRGTDVSTTDLIYRYEEDVFTPGDPRSDNLAGMIAAQVALNYGLFCRRIVFHGAFDAADRGFLLDMAANTAREIYVKKFLQDNPFISGEAAKLPVVKRPSYLQADVVFADPEPENIIRVNPDETNPRRIAISSSGGKDSLLSFGILNELGFDIHPIFGNESGRHWFTALNAHRHFQQKVPNSTRVWMNSDRVFSWMLRHFPFVRQDFATLRSDEYPIRLWTVAVFTFGLLPLLVKRSIGRLVIGDEYDTTVQASHKGVPHYDGLFDQSRYFDNALSRYYTRKGWALCQFSILRPLSELLIQRMLTLRYPNLFELQMSCHATHTSGNIVRPCGKCEKCRRIVGMVLASGGDPSSCGYTEDQVSRCLADLVVHPVHQERPGVEHLMWALKKKGILPASAKPVVTPKEHPEILKLRFDRERSPMNAVPQDLRAPAYRLFLEHAKGAVRRQGRKWMDVDILHDPGLHMPYAFERIKTHYGTRADDKSVGPGPILGEMTWPDAKRYLRRVDVALLPVGAIEQHGPHLPLDTDSFDADYLAKAVARDCSHPQPVVLPLVPYGVSYHHDEFAGTISISNQTLSRLVYEIGMSASRNGITKLVIINGHGGNSPALNFAAQEINRDSHIFVCVDTGETSDVDIYSMVDTPNDVHAGEIETSTSLAVRPELVKMQDAVKLVPRFSSRYLDFTSKRGISWYAFTKRISKSGVMGDPTKATAEKGRKMWEVMIKNLVEFVEELKALTLDEIFQRRY